MISCSHSLWHMVTTHWSLIIVYKSLLLYDIWAAVVAVAQVPSTLIIRLLVATVCCDTWPQHTEVPLLLPLCSLVPKRDKFLCHWVHRPLQFNGNCDIINKNIYDLVNPWELTYCNYVNMFTGWFCINLKSIRENPQDIILWPEVVLH